MILIERRFAKGYVRPVSRGIVFYDSEDDPRGDVYLDELVERAVGEAGGGPYLYGVTIRIEIERVAAHE